MVYMAAVHRRSYGSGRRVGRIASKVVFNVDKYRMISPFFSSVVSKSTVYVG